MTGLAYHVLQFLRTGLFIWVYVESGSCTQVIWSAVFQGPLSFFGIHRTRKQGLGLLAVLSSVLHLCSWPGATGSARSSGSAVVLCVYSTVMLLPSWRFIEPLPQSKTVPGSCQGTCYGDLLICLLSTLEMGGLFFFFFFLLHSWQWTCMHKWNWKQEQGIADLYVMKLLNRLFITLNETWVFQAKTVFINTELQIFK